MKNRREEGGDPALVFFKEFAFKFNPIDSYQRKLAPVLKWLGMRIPRLSLIYIFLIELLSKRTLRREPEAALVMTDTEEVQAYRQAIQSSGALSALYIFIVARACQSLRGCKRVIDLGCGPAHQLALLAELMPDTQFTGIDLSDTMLAVARETIQSRGLKNVDFRRMDFSTLDSLESQSVDGIFSSFAIHHLPSDEHFESLFLNMRRVLKPQGSVFLFDLGRLKSLRTVMYFAYRDRESLPYVFSLDFERSLRAAFTLEDFQKMSEKYFEKNLEVLGTFKASMMVMIKTQDHALDDRTLKALKAARNNIASQYRKDLDDLRMFFRLSGLKNDPFRNQY